MLQQQIQDQNEINSSFNLIPRSSYKPLNPKIYRLILFIKQLIKVLISISLYYVAPGNNSKLIISAMQKRKNWQESENYLFHFQWNMNDKNFQYCSLNQSQIQIVNHLPNHRELTLKCNLIRNLKQFCQTNKKYVWDITPLSFIVEFNAQENNLNKVLKEFTLAYEQFQPLSSMKTQFNYFTKHNSQYFLPKMHHSFLDEENNYIWILKPNEFNRGRGIQFFRTIEELKSLLKNFNKGSSEYQFSQGKIKSSSFVIQKPLLLDGRKFDIRVWVLVTYTFDIFIFNQGYARLSSDMFDLNNLDAFIHLTNNAVQKYSKNYGFFELGNQMSYSELNYYTNGEFTKTVLPKIKSIIVLTWMAVQNTFKKCKYSFEIFGYDFMLQSKNKKIYLFLFCLQVWRVKNLKVIFYQQQDEIQLCKQLVFIITIIMLIINKKIIKFTKYHIIIIWRDIKILLKPTVDEQLKPWLIEINTNPCLEESSPLLKELIPKMINDAFKIVIDPLFTKINEPTDWEHLLQL